MNSLSKLSFFALVFAVVFGFASAQPETRTLPADNAPASLCHFDNASAPAMTPMCNYLERCCSGGTENAKKCCAAYFQKC